MLRAIISLIFLVGAAHMSAYSQVDPQSLGYYFDAVRYSQTFFSGSARFQGIGGAGVALGGDIGSANINPAGLGFNRRSEFVVGIGTGFHNASGDYLGSQTDDSKFNINMPILGAIFSNQRGGSIGNLGGSFAISVSRINDFNQNILYQGVNNQHSIVDYFLQNMDGTPWTVYDQQGIESNSFDLFGLAYATYLVNPDIFDDPGDLDTYYTFLPLPSEKPITQRQQIETSGAQYEWNFSYGGNFDDTFYYGVGLGLQTVRYNRKRIYSESIEQPNDIFNKLDLSDELGQNGAGVNLKAGIIFRPIDALRIGASAVSPTFMRITESYSHAILARYNDYRFLSGTTENGQPIFQTLRDQEASTAFENISFSLRSPARLTGGIALFWNKNGFLTADVEYVAYSTMKLGDPRYEIDGASADFDFEADNRTIKRTMENVVNLKVGAEYRLDSFRFRAGYAYYRDPFEINDLAASATSMITGGIGYRKENFYTDFVIVARSYESAFSPYGLFDYSTGREVDISPVAQVSNSRTNAFLTFGFMF